MFFVIITRRKVVGEFSRSSFVCLGNSCVVDHWFIALICGKSNGKSCYAIQDLL